MSRALWVIGLISLVGCAPDTEAVGPAQYIRLQFDRPPTDADRAKVAHLGGFEIQTIRLANTLIFRSSTNYVAFDSLPNIWAKVVSSPATFVPVIINLRADATPEEVAFVDSLSTYPHATSLFSARMIISWFHLNGIDILSEDANVHDVAIDDGVVEVTVTRAPRIKS